MNIYVGNMHFSLTNEDVNNLFSQFGSVTSAKIINDKVTGRSKGFGFVEMENDEDARKAIAGLNESEVMGRKLIVNEARPQEQRSGGGGGGIAAVAVAATTKAVVAVATTRVAEAAVTAEAVAEAATIKAMAAAGTGLTNFKVFIPIIFARLL